VLEEALRAGVERVVYTSSVAAIGPAAYGSTADESHAFRAGRHGVPYVNAKHEGRRRRCASARRPAGRGGQPGARVRPRDLYRSSTELVRRFLRRQIPAYVDGALNIVEPRTWPTANCSRTSAASWASATSGQPQLHAGPSVRRPRPPVGRGAAGDQAPRSGRAGGRARRGGDAGPPRSHSGRDPGHVAVVGVSVRPRPSASWGGSPPTTRTRWSARSPGTASESRSASRRRGRASRFRCA